MISQQLRHQNDANCRSDVFVVNFKIIWQLALVFLC